MKAHDTAGFVAQAVRDTSAERAMVRRTHQPVHRRSYHAGERERRDWARFNRFSRRQNNARMRALEEIERTSRAVPPAEGRRRPREANVMMGVYRFMLRLRGRRDGRLDPTYATIAAALGYAASAVKKAARRLEALGFLRWIRRTQLLEEPTPGGQYVEQISNAYVLELSGRAAELVRQIGRDREDDPGPATPTDPARMTPDEREAVIAAALDPATRDLLRRMAARRERASPSGGLNPTM